MFCLNIDVLEFWVHSQRHNYTIWKLGLYNN